jgi:hypothetical protein
MLYTRLSFQIAFLCLVISSFEEVLVKQVFILKLKQKVLRQNLEKIVYRLTEVQIRKGQDDLSDKFHLDLALPNGTLISKYFDKTRGIHKEIEESTPPLAVEYIRSLTFCPGVPVLGFPNKEKGTNPQGFDIKCVGNETVGLYWNETQLQGYLDAHYIGHIKNINFTAVDDVSTFLNNLKLVNTIREIELPVIAEKFSKLALDNWDGLEISGSRRNRTNSALKELDALLLKVKIGNKTAQAISPNLAVFVDNIWETGSEGIVFLEENSDKNKSAMALMENTSSDDILSFKPR